MVPHTSETRYAPEFLDSGSIGQMLSERSGCERKSQTRGPGLVGHSGRRTNEVGQRTDVFGATDRGVHLSARGGGMKGWAARKESSGGPKSEVQAHSSVFPFSFIFYFSIPFNF